MSDGGDSLSLEELDAAYLRLHYERATQMENQAASDTALLDLAYQRGTVEQVLSDLRAKAREEVDEIAKREGGSGGEPTADSEPRGAADVGPSPVG